MLDVTCWMMTRNEEFWGGHVLSAILESGMPRVIVADTGSTDATLAILREAVGGDPRVTFLEWPGGNATAESVTATRQRMLDATVTEFGMIIDADEFYYPDKLREVLAQNIPPHCRLAHTSLDVIRWHGGAFWRAERFGKEAFFRVAGLHWERGYPFEAPFYGSEPCSGPRHYFGGGPHGMHFHNLRRSSRDDEVLHRGDMPTREPLVAKVEMPFDLGRWPNEYADMMVAEMLQRATLLQPVPLPAVGRPHSEARVDMSRVKGEMGRMAPD